MIKFLASLLLLFGPTGLMAGISGKILLDPEWHDEIYLSLLTDFAEMNMANEELIIDRARIAEDGSFFFDDHDLPESERLYRIHVILKYDPPSTIIIGGRNNNHVHFIFQKGQEISIAQKEGKSFSGPSLIRGSEANDILNKYRELIVDRKKNRADSQRERELRDDAFKSDLEELMLSSKSRLATLFLIRMQCEIFGELPDLELIQGLIKVNGQEQSPYLEALQQDLRFREFEQNNVDPAESSGLDIFLILLAIAVLLLLVFAVMRLRRKKPGISQLSIKEREVLRYLKEGRPNKEIANELNIELGTVKSHVTSILQKLKLSSRKDILDRKDL